MMTVDEDGTQRPTILQRVGRAGLGRDEGAKLARALDADTVPAEARTCV